MGYHLPHTTYHQPHTTNHLPPTTYLLSQYQCLLIHIDDAKRCNPQHPINVHNNASLVEKYNNANMFTYSLYQITILTSTPTYTFTFTTIHDHQDTSTLIYYRQNLVKYRKNIEITGNHKKHAQILPMHRKTIQYVLKLITKPWKKIRNHAKILRHLVKT